MRIRKPAGVQTKSLLFRPRQPLHGKFSIGLTIDTPRVVSLPGFPAANAVAVAFDWCGSRRQLAFGPSLSGFATNLRLPQNLSEGDVYVLSISAAATLLISVDLYGDEEAVENIEIEELNDVPNTKTVCADPSVPGDRKFEDHLAANDLVKPVRPFAPLGRIESLRPLAEGAALTLEFRRPLGAETISNIVIWALVGEVRKVCAIPPGQLEAKLYFRLLSPEGGEIWPLTLAADHQFLWSGAADRGFDRVFLPAFSFEK
jgi:hypothetical protein